MLKEIIIAIAAYGKAHTVIRRYRLWKWIILPGLLYMALFLAGFYFFTQSVRSTVSDELLGALGVQEWLESTDSFLLNFVFSFTGLVIWLVAALFYFSLFKYVWLILGSPVFAWLSERTEAITSGKSFEFSMAQMWRDIRRAVRIALRNMLWQSVYFLSLFILAFIPLVGWVVPFFAVLIEAYYFGFSMIDYSLERRNTDAASSIRYIGSHRGLAIGNGLIFYLMLLIPVVGWVLAPTYAVVAATISVVKPGEALTGEAS